MSITTKQLLLILSLSLASCSEPAPAPKIDRTPAPANFFLDNINRAPFIIHYNPESDSKSENDVRSQNITALDLRNYGSDLLWANFDSQTVWPSPEKMPENFDLQQVMETGKNPGLGVYVLHKRGITGKGVGIAIIDQPLLVEHEEYASRLRLYEEMNIVEDTKATMHGAGVASIAVGKTAGVAPGADLYFIATYPGTYDEQWKFNFDYSYYAQAIRRVLEINRDLPAKKKIKVISMQIGWTSDITGVPDIQKAVQEASADGVFVISSSLSETHGLYFMGLSRDPLGDPDNFQNYRIGWWLRNEFYAGTYSPLPATLLVPMDNRTTASPTGADEYAYYGQGGISWAIPYLAGSYALALQVRPDLKPEDFWNAALKSGRTIEIEHDGRSHQLGIILDPVALVAALGR